MADGNELITLGRVAGAHGVRGWIKVHAYTESPENLLAYADWRLELRGTQTAARVEQSRVQPGGLLVKLADVNDRDTAAALRGALVKVPHAELPPLPEGEYYWRDLEGLRVTTVAGVELGRVDHMLATGANDVLVVTGERQRMIPYLPGQVVIGVDLQAGVIRVDWDPEF